MQRDDFNKFFWGFLFIMINFRIQGIDILPDIIGYIFFIVGFASLSSHSRHFAIARNLDIPMIILSAFSIYHVQPQNGEAHFVFLGLLVSVASIVLNLLIVYNLFMGIKDMADGSGQAGLYGEADKRWNQYLMLQIAAILGILLILFIPPIAVIFVIGLLAASIVLTVVIMGFMKRCGMYL